MVSCKGFDRLLGQPHEGQTEGSSVTEGSSQRKHAGTSVLKERRGAILLLRELVEPMLSRIGLLSFHVSF